MNYAKSKGEITPVTNDTPCLLSALRARLKSKTKHHIPCFMMPVKTETRFMKDQPSSLLDSDCLHGTHVLDLATDFSVLISAAAAHLAFRGYTSETTVAAAREIKAEFMALKSNLEQKITGSINPAERDKLEQSFKKLAYTSAQTATWLTENCSEPNLQQELSIEINETTTLAEDIAAFISNTVISNDWELEVSQTTIDTWSVLPSIVATNQNILAGYIINGQLQENAYSSFLSSVSGVFDLFKTLPENDFDKLYVWTMLPDLHEQLVTVSDDLGNIGNEDARFRLYKLRKKLNEAWQRYILPNMALQRYRPVEKANQVTISPDQVGPEVLKAALIIEDSITIADNAIKNMQAVAKEMPPLVYDIYMDSIGDNDLAGAQIFKFRAEFDRYMQSVYQIADALTGLSAQDANEVKFLAQRISIANAQVISVVDAVNSVTVPPPPETTAARPGSDPDPGPYPGDDPDTWEPGTYPGEVEPDDPSPSPPPSPPSPGPGPDLGTGIFDGGVVVIDIDIFDDGTIRVSDHWDDVWTGGGVVIDFGGPIIDTDFGTPVILDELWIRVYPDEISLDSFEKSLTGPEIDSGTAYWTGIYAAHGSPVAELAAWHGIVAGHGTERAEWIIYAMTPENHSEQAYKSPVFKVMDHIDLLTEYTASLTEVAMKQAIDSSHIEFYVPQLEYLNSAVAGIQAVPQDIYAELSGKVEASAAKFSALAELPGISVAYSSGAPSMKIFADLIGTIHTGYLDLSGTVDVISVLSSWDDIYTTPPVFPSVTTTDSSWDKPSVSRVMPDRFLFAAIDDATTDIVGDAANFGSHIFKHIALGRLIPEELRTGIDPHAEDFDYWTATEDLKFTNDELKWVIDFPVAINKGMAKALRMMGTEATKGFDKVLVMGIRLFEKDNKPNIDTLSKNLLQDLFASHRYTRGGMAFLEVGTPTNNTDNESSGFSTADANSAISYSTTGGGALFTAQTDFLLRKDGQWLADALGIEYSFFQHIKNADKSQISNSIAMNRALWGGTISNYMKEMMSQLFTDDNVTRTREYFTDYVLASGALPSIRIKNQPYGILPVTSFGRWEWHLKYDQHTPFPQGLKLPPSPPISPDTDIFSPPGGATPKIGTYSMWDYASDGIDLLPPGIGGTQIDAFLQDRYNIRLYNALEQLNKVWLEMSAWHTKTVDKSHIMGTSQADFLYMLGSDATMAEASTRYFVNNRKFADTANFALHKSGRDGLPSLWTTPPPPAGISTIPEYFNLIFNNFLFPLNAIPSLPDPAFHPLGDKLGLFDTKDFLDYLGAVIPSATNAYSGNSPIPRYDWIRNALQMFNVNFISPPLPYTLRGATVSETTLSPGSFLPAIASYSGNYIQWLQSPGTSLWGIYNNNNAGTMPSRSLLYLLLRQSVLLTYRNTVMDIYEGYKPSVNPVIVKNPIFAKNIKNAIGTPESIVLQMANREIGYASTPLNKWYFLFKKPIDIFKGDSTFNTSDIPGASPPTQDYNLAAIAWLFNTYNSSRGPGEWPPNVDFSTFDAAHIGVSDPSYPGYSGTIYERLGVLPAGFLDGRMTPDKIDELGVSAFASTNVWFNKQLDAYLRQSPPSPLIPEIEERFDRKNINSLDSGLSKIKSASIDELDRLLRGHIDLCTYRLDAWNYGMVNKRLLEFRKTELNPSARVKGIYLGAYGWLIDVRPDANINKVSSAAISEYLAGPTETVYFDSANLGAIHTASLTHALTAALLRSGYKSENNNADNRMAVNLSSERIKLANSLIEGVRSGQTINSLIGYMFERNMHDRNATTSSLALDKYIYSLRRAFPLIDPNKINNNQHAAAGSGDSTVSPPYETRPVNLIDGIAMLESFRNEFKYLLNQHPRASIVDLYNNPATLTAPLPSGAYINATGAYNNFILNNSLGAGMPPSTSPDAFAVIKEIDRIANAVDALGDLMLAEGIFQGAKGNFDRSSAIFESLTEGKAPVEPEILDTPISAVKVHHKMAAMLEQIDSLGTYPVSVPSDWGTISSTFRSETERSLNLWIAKILHSQIHTGITISDYPSKVKCKVTYTVSGTSVDHFISLNQLNIKPIDLIYLVSGGNYTGEMKSRIIYTAKTVFDLAHNLDFTVDYSQKDDGTASFSEVLPLISALAKVISGSRWMKSADFISSTVAAGAGAPYNLTELENRYTVLTHASTGKLTLLKNTLAAYTPGMVTSDGTFTTLKNKLIESANMGIIYAVPDSGKTGEYANAQILAKHISLAHTAAATIEDRLAKAAVIKTMSEAAPTNDEKKVKGLVDSLSLLLGGFKVIPHFSFANYVGLQATVNSILQALDTSPASPPGGNILSNYIGTYDEVMDDWMYGLARVRENIDTAETIKMICKNDVNHPLLQLRPIQLPYANTDYWLGLEYPTSYTPPSDKFSVTVFDHNKLKYVSSPPGGPLYLSGIIIDEWAEEIPFDEQTTGVTFNYRQPHAKPPQNVLLAINPQAIQNNSTTDTAISKSWRLEDLLHTLLDTIDMAKIRMVEPDDFKKIEGSSLTSPHTFAPASGDEIKRTNAFDVFRWVLPAIVGEVTPKNHGMGSAQTVSFDYHINNSGPTSVGPGSGTYPGGPIVITDPGSSTGVFTGGVGPIGPVGPVIIDPSLPSSSSASSGVFTGGTGSGPIIPDPSLPSSASASSGSFTSSGAGSSGSHTGPIIYTTDPSVSAPASGHIHIPTPSGMTEEEFLTNPDIQEYVLKYKALSDLAGLQDKLTSLTI